jgi:CRISPR/Cas system-associated exonuclease Cas4 (RecB family)
MSNDENISKIAELRKAWLSARDRLNDEMACQPDPELAEEMNDWQGRVQARLVRTFVDSY